MKSLCPTALCGSHLYLCAKCPRVKSIMSAIFSVAIALVMSSSVFATTYNGTNTGAIPNGGSPTPTCGAPLDVQFLVSDFPSGYGSASVSFTATHSFIGHLEVTLIAPNGTSHLLFSRVGATTADSAGDNADLNGTYTFNDLATDNIWTLAASSPGNGFEIPNAAYRTQAAGPNASVSPGPAFTSMNAAFAALGQAEVNGLWILRFRDCATGGAGGDTGAVSAAALTLIPTLAGDVVLGGRVLTASGAGLKGAYVTISGGDLAAPRTITTSTFGHYVFDELSAGQTYIVSVAARRYTFQPPAMAVSLESDLSEVNFVANQ